MRTLVTTLLILFTHFIYGQVSIGVDESAVSDYVKGVFFDYESDLHSIVDSIKVYVRGINEINEADSVIVFIKNGTYMGSELTPEDWTMAGWADPDIGDNDTCIIINMTNPIEVLPGETLGVFITNDAVGNAIEQEIIGVGLGMTGDILAEQIDSSRIISGINVGINPSDGFFGLSDVNSDSAFVGNVYYHIIPDIINPNFGFDQNCDCDAPGNCVENNVHSFFDTLIVQTDPPNGYLVMFAFADNERIISFDDPCQGDPNPGPVEMNILSPDEGTYFTTIWITDENIESTTITISIQDNNTDYDTPISLVDFADTCPSCTPDPIPTMGQWGLIILTLMLIIGGILYLNLKKSTFYKIE